MEVGLGVFQDVKVYSEGWEVLILVLMEVGLGVLSLFIAVIFAISLNPCFNGNLVKTSAETKPSKGLGYALASKIGLRQVGLGVALAMPKEHVPTTS